MKYWKELNELEESIYQIKVIQSGLNLISESEQFTCYFPSNISQSFQTFVLDLNERMNEAVQKLDEQFKKVWDTVRTDTPWDNYSDLPAPSAYEQEDGDDEFTNEDIAAINDLVKDHEANIRFDKIISNLPTMNTQDSYVTAGAIDDSGITLGNIDEYFNIDFRFDPASENTLADIKINFSEENNQTMDFHSNR